VFKLRNPSYDPHKIERELSIKRYTLQFSTNPLRLQMTSFRQFCRPPHEVSKSGGGRFHFVPFLDVVVILNPAHLRPLMLNAVSYRSGLIFIYSIFIEVTSSFQILSFTEVHILAR
jgi:hypothetical protein